MKNWKNLFNYRFQNLSKSLRSLLALLFMAQIIVAQIEDHKTIKDVYSGKDAVSLINSNGSVLVKKSPDNKVYIETSISAKAKDRENLDILLSHFGIKSGGDGKRLDLSTVFQIESCNTINNNSTIKFKDGTKAKGIKDFSISTTLLIPDLNELKLNNKYGDINIETEVSGDLYVVLFSGKLETNSLCNNLDLTLKYSKGFLQNAGDAKMELFDSDLFMGDLFSAEVNSKYSEVEMKNVGGNLNIQTFDDKWKIGHIKGNFKFDDKYSEYEFGSFNEAEGSIFDGEIIATSGNKLFLTNSKYTKYKLGNIQDFKSSISFDDQIEIGKANSIAADNSKYTEYMIEKLEHSFFSADAFDDNIKLAQVSTKFKTINVNGKYVKMDFNIDTNAQFSVDVNMQHGKFNHPDFDVRLQKETNNTLVVKGYAGGEKSDSNNSLTITGFDNTVYWR